MDSLPIPIPSGYTVLSGEEKLKPYRGVKYLHRHLDNYWSWEHFTPYLRDLHSNAHMVLIAPIKKRYISRLIKDIKVLGLADGIRYWKAENLALKNPDFILRWAEQLSRDADDLAQKTEDDLIVSMMRVWSGILKTQHWVNQKKIIMEIAPL